MKTILLIGLIFCQLSGFGGSGKNQSNHLNKEAIMNAALQTQTQNPENIQMTGKQVLIDKFFVPREAYTEFVTRMKLNTNFIKNLPGFDGDQAYEHSDENGNFIFMTVATWRSVEDLNKAKGAVRQEYERINFNPPEMLNRLHIRMEREIYSEFAK